ncbi:MAG: hypothetical protein V4450_10000 [Bacteroidota bacterium]
MKPKPYTHITDGISQSDRFPASLDPAFFQIDERNANDFLQYLLKLSKKFNFYDLTNTIEGDWEDFFLSDINVVVRIITKFDINTFIRRYDQLKSRLMRETDDESLIADLRELFQFTFEFILFQVKLHSKFATIPKSETGITEFRRITQEYNTYDEEIKALNAWLISAKKHFGETFGVNFDSREKTIVSGHGFNENEVDIFTELESNKDKIRSSLKKFDILFSRVRTKYYRLQEAADIFIHKRNETGTVYAPHMGLLIAFFELYTLLKKEINVLPKKHLDYYYHDILGLGYKSANPDRVYIQAEINPSIDKTIIEKGDVLLLDRPGITENNLFLADADTVITKAKIRQMFSVYISELVKLTSKTDDHIHIYEQQVFVAENPVTQPSDHISQKPGLRAWPLMGEDQEDISLDEMTMQPADIGFVIASPLLYAKDGKRSFNVKLYLSAASFRRFRQYALDYAQVSETHPRIVMHSMLKESFYLHVSGAEDWIRIYKYNINCSIEEDTDQCIDIHFELMASDPATAKYNPSVHGNSYETELPLLWLKLNNSSFYNPYTFFKGIILERIAIRLSVTESRQLKLRNNIGEISMVNPFQLFGPQPAMGSYLDLKNTNIFNKYIKDFSVKFHWFDLPNEKGGFEAYYAGYPNNIKNDSFVISLSALNEGLFYPQPEEQQRFSLFAKKTDASEKGTLSKATLLNQIDFLKVRFENTLSLDAEENITETNFKEGAIRFELVSPPDAFGSRVFTGLFPKVVMHNARRFVKKVPIPNQPYIPVLKNITIDYELEHSESLSSVHRENSLDNGIFLWHKEPFGYQKVYPGKSMESFQLLREIPYQSNLLLGLESVIPGELLSLLFKFEENNFNPFNYIPEKIEWSVLDDNTWVIIPESDVLLDETSNFIKTGMVVLRLPEVSDKTNTILPSSLYWLKASCNNRGDIRSKTTAVFAQVFAATRQLTKEDEITEDALFLDPGTLSRFQKKNSQILNLFQPFASVNGKTKETGKQFYTRVSELLRHKNRAITATDISQLVLEAFPKILKVKCFETEINGQSILPGVDILVVVILNQQNKQLSMQEYPKVDLSGLFSIKQYLSGIVSPYTTVEVVNPVYEKIKIVCSVVFSSETEAHAVRQSKTKESQGILLQKLNRDIKQWLSPWLYNPGENINTEGKIYLSEVLNFIKRCPYVSYVTGFSVLHFYQVYDVKTGDFYDRVLDSSVRKTEYLKASLPHALLVSSSEHSITVLDKPHYVEPGKTGIGGMQIGNELLVADVNEYFPLTDADTHTDENNLFTFYFNPNNS